MTLKEKIESDFKTAFKEKDGIRKTALRGLKAKITESEKLNHNQPLAEDAILRIITTAIKQRRQSIEEFDKGNRQDLSNQEKAELSVLETYLPPQLTDDDILVKLKNILEETGLSTETNRAKKIGQLTGHFNKKYQGQFDSKKLKEIIEKMIM